MGGMSKLFHSRYTDRPFFVILGLYIFIGQHILEKISMKSSIRVRFAPSPTGFMHLGNVRAALLNFLFASHYQGTFILRIEDTDPQRNVDLEGKQILADLGWLSLNYSEGPIIQGPYAPYYQSQRAILYDEYLKFLQEKNRVYRCFCTAEELEKKRQRQIALKQAPRYDRSCAQLSQAHIAQNLEAHIPYIWRFSIGSETVMIQDLARGMITYDLTHFSDTPLTRQDKSFTFIFANFVDDHVMKISHIIRCEDHLTNTAVQAALYKAFDAEIPVFWHLPIIVNTEGKKLSKRDFGFSLNDLRDSGYLPQAINNYLAIIGGGSFEQEVMSLEELKNAIKFEALASTGHIKYDLEKLRWLNHKWIAKLSPRDLATHCHPFLQKAYPDHKLSLELLEKLLTGVQTDLVTLADSVKALEYCFIKPQITVDMLAPFIFEKSSEFFTSLLKQVEQGQDLLTSISPLVKQVGADAKKVYALVRLALTGSPQGPSIKDLVEMLGKDEVIKRLQILIQ